jgi:4-amino-4-deoxy-L-arabinose transferase-like glycosyltransferase
MGKPGLAGPPAAVVRSRIAVPALGILALALAIAVVPLDVLSRQGSPAEPLVAAASFTAVGLVVARRRPRNPTGWLLAVIGILILLTVAGGYYAVLVYRLRDRLPLGPLALVFDVFLGNLAANKTPAVRRWARRENAGLCLTPTNSSWANPIEAHFGPLRTFVMGTSDHPNHPALACRLQAYLRWRNAHARHLGVLAAQRRERARIRSERQQHWGRPGPEAA